MKITLYGYDDIENGVLCLTWEDGHLTFVWGTKTFYDAVPYWNQYGLKRMILLPDVPDPVPVGIDDVTFPLALAEYLQQRYHLCVELR